MKYFASLREIVGKREEIIEVDHDASVKNLLYSLSNIYGYKFREYIFKPRSDSPRENLQFLIDGKSIRTLNGFETKLCDGCKFVIIPPVGGG